MDDQFMYNLAMGSNMPIAPVNQIYCLYCGDSRHSYEFCPSNPESFYYIGKSENQQRFNPNSNPYNQEWRDHQNLWWQDKQDEGTAQLYEQTVPPEFPTQLQHQYNEPWMPEEIQTSEISSLEELMLEYMAKNEAALRSLQIQMEQLVDEVRNSPPEVQNNMEPSKQDGEEQYEVMSFWSELEYEESKPLLDNDDPPIPDEIKDVEENNEVESEQQIEVSMQKEYKVPIVSNPSPLDIGPISPFPQHFLEKYHNIRKGELTIDCNHKVEEEIGEDEIGSNEGFFVEAETTIPIFRNKFMQVSHLPLELDLKAYCALKKRNCDMAVAEARSNELEEKNLELKASNVL